jgi:hypothetical protein
MTRLVLPLSLLDTIALGNESHLSHQDFCWIPSVCSWLRLLKGASLNQSRGSCET